MRLVDFLILLLEAHAQSLQRLAALFGEETLLHLLEEAGERADASPSSPMASQMASANIAWFDSKTGPGSSQSSAYAQLESAVRDLKLPAVLEFHLWAYPHYRAFIESPLELTSRIAGQGEAAQALVDEAIAQAANWSKQLPLPPSIGLQAERAAEIPWLRFRTEVLKRIGIRPMGAVK